MNIMPMDKSGFLETHTIEVRALRLTETHHTKSHNLQITSAQKEHAISE